ncbi:hypothetical protein [Methanobacterium aggregans]|uniref:hypothetical protein n=1 Tax=Methanobacterium aggregans TaxID=1615586 RepID=UPI001AE50F7F|nr:hypothetical protein [Methanobacterium aggregans]MBP2045715.1 hypothetical protein [Methanobacterium aggregans]
MKRGYRVCKDCGGRYDLQPGELPGELPGEFESRSCGGKLEYYDNNGHKRGCMPVYPNANRSKERSPLLKILIFFVVVYAVFHVFGGVVISVIGATTEVGSPGATYVFVLFMVIAIAVILVLLWILFKK